MEKKNKYYLVYKTTNLKNGKFYIGVHETHNINDGYLGSGKILRNSVYYHGKENFKREILEFCDDKRSMYLKEKELVTEDLIKNPKCMNLVVGGVGFINDEKHREISKQANNKLNKKRKENPEFNKLWLNNLKEGVQKSILNGTHRTWGDNSPWKGKHHTEESKKKIGESNSIKQKGEKNSQFGTCWITNGIENKKIKKEDKIPNDWKLGRI